MERMVSKYWWEPGTKSGRIVISYVVRPDVNCPSPRKTAESTGRLPVILS